MRIHVKKYLLSPASAPYVGLLWAALSSLPSKYNSLTSCVNLLKISRPRSECQVSFGHPLWSLKSKQFIVIRFLESVLFKDSVLSYRMLLFCETVLPNHNNMGGVLPLCRRGKAFLHISELVKLA